MLSHSRSFLQHCSKQRLQLFNSQKSSLKIFRYRQPNELTLSCNKNIKFPFMTLSLPKTFTHKYSTVAIQNYEDLDFSDLNEVKVTPPSSFETPIYNIKQEQIGTIKLPEYIFGTKVRVDILHRVVVWQRACKRKGTAKSKTRSEVSGSSRKLFPQKGRGAARVGTIRSPTRVGGGRAHGAKPRDYSYTLPKKVRAFGLRCALASKFAKHQLYIIDSSHIDEPKTKHVVEFLKNFKLDKESVLFVDGGVVDTNFALASNNVNNLTVLPQHRINVYDILKHKKLVLCKDVIPYLVKRLENPLEDPYEKERQSNI